MICSMQTWKSKLPEIKLEERTPLVDRLLEYIEEQKHYIEILREEINRLKDHKNKPKIRPSSLNSQKNKKKNNDSKKRDNSDQEFPSKPDRFEVIEVKGLPKGSRFKGYRTYQVQELVIYSERIEYRLERWQLPSGDYVVAELPFEIQKGHFGPTLQAYILHQHHHQGVTQPLLLSQLREWGVKISSGQLNHLLVDDKEKFHAEKADLLSVGCRVSRYLHVDDTGARHEGNNGYCTHIGNELFAWFESTGSKSRLNFLKLLHQSHRDHRLTDHAFSYMVRKNLSPTIREKLKNGSAYFADETSWKAHLQFLGIHCPRHIQIATEAALMGSILEHGFSLETVIVSDDAGQFNIFRHALCWVHIERNITKLIGEDSKKAEAVEMIRGQIWNLYGELKKYKEKAGKRARKHIEKQFDEMCQQKTCYQLLNLQLKKIRQSKHELLLVLERPDIPLHNNLSERDIREYVKRRKVSGTTRSEEGRRCRDTFASLKKTAIKLKVGFWDYLLDRVTTQNAIPWLPDLVAQKSKQIHNTAPGL
jgi:hypothetical protein